MAGGEKVRLRNIVNHAIIVTDLQTQAKREVLTAQGWSILPVSCIQWDGLPDNTARQKWLVKRVRAAAKASTAAAKND